MTINDIIAIGRQIAAETAEGGNTAARVGGVIEAIGEILKSQDYMSWQPAGNFDIEEYYEKNDQVFDAETNSCYVSLQTDNVGHPVNENDESYEEGWWMKVIDGASVLSAAAAATQAAAEANQAAEAARGIVYQAVDDHLDTESLKPVANQVVTQAINNLSENLQDVEENFDKELFDSTHAMSDNIFDWDVAGLPTTNNNSYITPSRTEDGARWTIIRAGGSTKRTGNVLIPLLELGKTYRIRFRYESTISNIINVWAAKFNKKVGANVTVEWAAALGSIEAGASGDYEVLYKCNTSGVTYIAFYTYQPAVNQYLDVSDIDISECESVEELANRVDESNVKCAEWANIMEAHTGYIPIRLSSYDYSGDTISEEPETNKFAGETVMSLSNEHQGCACYGDYLFVGVKENPILYIYDLSKNLYIGSVSLGSSYPIANTHANTIGFSNQRYDANDEFPILYINSGYGILDTESGQSTHHVYGVRITRVGNVFSASIVKTIIVKNTGGWIEFMCANSKAWIKGQHANDWGWYQVDMPALEDTEEIDLGNIAPVFTTSAITSTSQEHFFHNDKIYIIWGGTKGGYLSVLDTNTGTVVSVVDLKNLAVKEPEGFFIYKNHFYVLFMRQLWKLYFNKPCK